jgi:hypothetical protein
MNATRSEPLAHSTAHGASVHHMIFAAFVLLVSIDCEVHNVPLPLTMVPLPINQNVTLENSQVQVKNLDN